jgi:hypothetical protein
MTAFDDAKALVQHATQELPKIRAAYDASLHAKSISPALLVEIKNFFENLRSALDFAAHGLFDTFCPASAKNKPNIYFPYASAGQTRAAFIQSKRVETCIPGLTTARPDILDALLEMQHFGARGYTWLPTFMALNNENKHQRLVPQSRKEAKSMHIDFGGGAGIVMGEGAGISMGPGASIRSGNTVIMGGQSFDVNNPPRMSGGGKIEVITWVSFHFATNDEPVIPLLEKALSGVDAIVNELSAIK